MTVTELTDLKTTINWLLENGEFKDTETSYNIAMNAVDMLEKQLSIPLVSQQRELLAFKQFISKTPQAELEYYSDEEFTDLYIKANCA